MRKELASDVGLLYNERICFWRGIYSIKKESASEGGSTLLRKNLLWKGVYSIKKESASEGGLLYKEKHLLPLLPSEGDKNNFDSCLPRKCIDSSWLSLVTTAAALYEDKHRLIWVYTLLIDFCGLRCLGYYHDIPLWSFSNDPICCSHYIS